MSGLAGQAIAQAIAQLAEEVCVKSDKRERVRELVAKAEKKGLEHVPMGEILELLRLLLDELRLTEGQGCD